MALAVGLVLVAVLVFVIFRQAFVRPIRRLRDDVYACAAGQKDRVVHRCRIREVDTVAVALQRRGALPDVKTEKYGRRRQWTVSLGLVAAVMCVLIVGWVTAGVLTVVRPEPAALANGHVEENRQLVIATANSVRYRLDSGLSQVRLAVLPPPEYTRGYDLTDRMRRLMENEGVFRSVYVVDRSGAMLAEAGRDPMRTDQPIPGVASGLTQLNTSGRAPIIVAFAWTANGRKALVAEFDVLSLRRLLQSDHSHLRIVDVGLRTILDGWGYRAFTTLADTSLRNAAVTALHGVPTARVSEVDNDASALAALPLEGSEPDTGLPWVVLGDWQLGSTVFQDDPVTRATFLVVGLGATAAVIFFAWTWLLVIRPLRRVANVAAAVSDTGAGDVAVVERLDEIGAIGAGLNRCRRYLRPRTPDDDHSELDRTDSTMVSIRSADAGRRLA